MESGVLVRIDLGFAWLIEGWNDLPFMRGISGHEFLVFEFALVIGSVWHYAFLPEVLLAALGAKDESAILATTLFCN